jgi:hypothetical protein
VTVWPQLWPQLYQALRSPFLYSLNCVFLQKKLVSILIFNKFLQKIQILTIFDHLVTLFSSKQHFLTKSALFFRQSIGAENGNFTHFYLILWQQQKIHFKTSFKNWLPELFLLMQLTAFCSKTALFDKNYIIFPAKYGNSKWCFPHL